MSGTVRGLLVHGCSDHRPTGSLVGELLTADSNVLCPVAHPRSGSVGGVAASAGSVVELRHRVVLTPDGRMANGLADAVVGIPMSSGSGSLSSHHRGSRHETDGGVRLAGGRAGEVPPVADDSDSDQHSTSDGSSLPPPYSPHFVEAWCVCF